MLCLHLKLRGKGVEKLQAAVVGLTRHWISPALAVHREHLSVMPYGGRSGCPILPRLTFTRFATSTTVHWDCNYDLSQSVSVRGKTEHAPKVRFGYNLGPSSDAEGVGQN
jgi:hypothetical protein